jgi:hypothetical protein
MIFELWHDDGKGKVRCVGRRKHDEVQVIYHRLGVGESADIRPGEKPQIKTRDYTCPMWMIRTQ